MVDYSAYHWAKKAQQWAESIGTVLHYKGSVATYADLPSSDQVVGDMYNVLADGANYAWDGTAWDALSGVVDLSAYRTSADQDVIDSGKQPTLTQGTGINISNANVISVTSPTLTNVATGSDSLSILGTATTSGSATSVGISSAAGTNGASFGYSANGSKGAAIGTNSKATGSWATALGCGNHETNAPTATGDGAIAIGHDAHATATNAIQVFEGTNSTANSLQVKTYELLDTSTGLIPDARISTNIARTSAIPTDYVTTNTAQTITQDKAFSGTLVVADNVGLASGAILSNKKIIQKTSSGIEVGNSTEDVLLVGKSATVRPKYNGNDLALLSDASGLPSQTGQSGKFLTTDGTDASWAAVDVLPSQAGQAEKFLTTDGDNPSWATVSLFQPGMLMPYAGSSAPLGWLLCDGSAVSRTTYADLFDVIGTTYGTGDGSTTFNLPNFVNKTFWGGSTSGTVKSAGLPDIQGTIGGGAGIDGASGGGFGVLRDNEVSGAFTASKVKQYAPAKGSAGWGGTDGNARQTATFKASDSNPIYGSSSTVQPPAIQTLIIIKY